jgi:hypothetical protein
MNKTELLQLLRCEDEVTLLELLEISSTDLVDNFLDKIEDKLEHLYGQYKEEEREL